jgi:hypothetical protein
MPAQPFADHRCDYGRTSTTTDEGTCGAPATVLGVDVYTHGRIEEPLCPEHVKARVTDHMTHRHTATWLTWRMEPLANIWPGPRELPTIPEQTSRDNALLTVVVRHAIDGILAGASQ